MLTLELALRRDPHHVPGEPELLEQRDHERRRVEQPLPAAQAVASRAREGVVVVVPRLAEARAVRARRRWWSGRPSGSGGVPRKWHTELTLHVMWCTRKIRTSPPQSRPVAAPASVPVSAQPAKAGIARLSSTSSGKLAIDGPHARVLVEVLGVAAGAGTALVREQPARVRVPQAAKDPGRAVAVPDVRAVRIALLVSVRVVLAMVGNPAHHRALDGHRAEDARTCTRGASEPGRTDG